MKLAPRVKRSVCAAVPYLLAVVLAVAALPGAALANPPVVPTPSLLRTD